MTNKDECYVLDFYSAFGEFGEHMRIFTDQQPSNEVLAGFKDLCSLFPSDFPVSKLRQNGTLKKDIPVVLISLDHHMGYRFFFRRLRNLAGGQADFLGEIYAESENGKHGKAPLTEVIDAIAARYDIKGLFINRNHADQVPKEGFAGVAHFETTSFPCPVKTARAKGLIK